MADWPEGVDLRVHDSIDSTMAEAARIAPTITRPTWVFSLHQTAARGRRGRPWAMPAGNFAASLVMQPGGSPQMVALRSFVASLALRDALFAAGAGEDTVALKWPNDVLVNGGKLAGILLESVGRGASVDHLVVGIGVNLAAAPGTDAVEQGAVRPVALMTELGLDIAPRAFLELLAPAFAHHEAQFTTYGFAPVRQAWLHGAARLGQTITARLSGGGQIHTGTFRDVDMDGNLVLETPDGTRRIAAAEVFF